MLIALVIILLLIWAAVVWSIYSNFMVFYSNFAESESYHRAYYNSIAALERAELVIKQRTPWYIWSGWWISWVNTWSYKVWGSDRIIESNFSYISDSSIRNNTSIYWDINSRTTRVPSEKQWDIDSMLSYNDTTNPNNPDNSNNYNMMDYKDSQVFLLYYDKSDWNPYTKIKCDANNNLCIQSQPSEIIWTIRLPKKLKDSFGELDTDHPLVPDQEKNDAIVDWQFRWKYKDSEISTPIPFNIYSTQKYLNGDINDIQDSAIRESDINWNETTPQLNFDFWQNKWSPTSRWGGSELTIISPQEIIIKWDLNSASLKHFNILLTSVKYKEKQLRLSLLNLLKTSTPDNTVDMVYPFLEYYVDFWTGISDKYFTINAEWNYNDYKINRLIWKPTNKESVLWSFTTIF